MRSPRADDPPLATIADIKRHNSPGVRVWCHFPGCARQDKEIMVPWDKIAAPDTKPFVHLKFRCSVCGEAKTTFQPLWPHLEGMGPRKNFVY